MLMIFFCEHVFTDDLLQLYNTLNDGTQITKINIYINWVLKNKNRIIYI